MITPNAPSTFFNGKLINEAAIEPPKTIIIEGTSMNGVSPPPPIAIDARMRPNPIIRPMIVAMSICVYWFEFEVETLKSTA